jgi:hypothetical protein
MGHDEAADDEKDVDATAPKRRPLIALREVVAGMVHDDHQSGHRPQVLDPVDPERFLGVCTHDAGWPTRRGVAMPRTRSWKRPSGFDVGQPSLGEHSLGLMSRLPRATIPSVQGYVMTMCDVSRTLTASSFESSDRGQRIDHIARFRIGPTANRFRA